MKIMLTVAYDGSNYCGWQRQKNGISIEQVLEETLNKITGENIKITGSGRTDAGVHAKGQVASFESNSSVPPEKFSKAMNSLLPSDIRVVKSEKAQADFDARKSAKRKTYAYTFYLGETENPLVDRYALFLEKTPDLSLMQECLDMFVGEKDFACFKASGSGAKTTVRTIYSATVSEEKENTKKIVIRVTGNGFLYNMVRTLVGTALQYSYGKTNEKTVKEMLSTGNRKLCGKTLPAKGLCLESVEY